MGNNCDDIDWEKVKAKETLYISSLFDLCEWWKNVGRKIHPMIYPVLPSIIALPPSNAFLEHIFSACTWFDDPLRQRLKDKHFEMAVLIAVKPMTILSMVWFHLRKQCRKL